MKPLKISIIGAGNVAWQLSHALQSNGFEIVEIISRNPEHAMELAISLKTRHKSTTEAIDTGSDGYFICIKDDAIDELGYLFSNIKGFVAHVSGTKSIDALKGYSPHTGVFYPLQTFSRFRKINWREIPVFIEASDVQTAEALHYIGGKISNHIKELNSTQRSWLHLSAVLVSNFPNYLYTLAEEMNRENRLDFKDLLPLIKESVLKLENASPATLQTGPAIREDHKILQKHLEMLSGKPEIKMIYEVISESIQLRHHTDPKEDFSP